ncbi:MULTISPECIES: helix-turn-helix transcriptional regulator [unclassified Frankia]|uniref:helix-turn-helix domain-containing protein n=1 Tax=unclassified Frankia TaxID=2632575 RepID=UPI0027DB2E2F|nr:MULTISPECIES: helix-turn-helix transcriptional regulator [unclassified Frankia]
MEPLMSHPPVPLARRLRQLRESGEPRLSQLMVAKALGVSVATVSSDENVARVPAGRLAAYARLHAAPRPDAEGLPRLAGEEELTDEERTERDDLLVELTALHEDATVPLPELASVPGLASLPGASQRRTWHFNDGAPVRIICGQIPPDDRPQMGLADSVNYTELFTYADVDALVELFGHIRAENPALDVRFLTSANITSDDLSAHLVLLGGLGWNQSTEWYNRQTSFPVVQVEDPAYPDGEVFETRRGDKATRHYPKTADSLLVEDVGLLVRTPNPYNQARTLTICNGVYSRGVLGAVRCLTDANFRDRNEQHIIDKFGDAPEFGVLMRVPVHRGKTVTPDLVNEYSVIFEWPERT